MRNSVSGSHTLDQVIGANLGRIRKERGYKPTAFAELMRAYIGQGWSRQEVYRYESGARAMTAQELVAASMVLQTTVAELTASRGQVQVGVQTVGGHELTDALNRTSAEAEGWQRFETARAALAEMRNAAERYVEAIGYVRARVAVSPALEERIREDAADSQRRLIEELAETEQMKWPEEWGDMSGMAAVAANATPALWAARDAIGSGYEYEALGWAWSVRKEASR